MKKRIWDIKVRYKKISAYKISSFRIKKKSDQKPDPKKLKWKLFNKDKRGGYERNDKRNNKRFLTKVNIIISS